MAEKNLDPFDVENQRLAGEVQMIEFIRQVQLEAVTLSPYLSPPWKGNVDALAKRAAQLIRWHDFKGEYRG
jgi:hypothetical protein